MKNIFTFLLLIVIPLYSLGADRIDWIKKEYSEIRNNLENYEKKNVDFLGESAEGAGAVAYVAESGEIKLIEVTYFGEMGKAGFEFYYSNNQQVFFILEQSYSYNTHMMMTEEMANEWAEEDGIKPEVFDPGKTELKEWRYYFEGEKAVRVLNSKKEEVVDSKKVKRVLEISSQNLSRFEKSLTSQANRPAAPPAEF